MVMVYNGNSIYFFLCTPSLIHLFRGLGATHACFPFCGPWFYCLGLIVRAGG